LHPWIRVRRDNLEVFYAALPVELECNFHRSLQALTVFCELRNNGLKCDCANLRLI
jgi:hypothetical protein